MAPSGSRAVIAASLLAGLLITGQQAVHAQRGRGLSPTLQQASQLLRDGKTAEALASVRQELQSNPTSMQAATMLDVLGATTDARAVFQRAIDGAADPAAKAAAQRAMAMSYAFDGDCTNTVKLEEQVIAYCIRAI